MSIFWSSLGCDPEKDPTKIGGNVNIFFCHFRLLRIRIHIFLGLLDPDPFIRGMDPDPSIIKKKLQDKPRFYCFVTSF
jgi:hypothetical protein